VNKKELIAFKGDVEKVLAERRSVGDFDVHAKYMVFLLANMSHLIDHAISQYPKPVKK